MISRADDGHVVFLSIDVLEEAVAAPAGAEDDETSAVRRREASFRQ